MTDLMRLDCEKCKGSGRVPDLRDPAYPHGATRDCYQCDGVGTFPPFDAARILECIVTRGKLRASLSSYAAARKHPKGSDARVHATRGYFVWRMARFHGGADVTMPVTAEMVIDGDPTRKTCEQLAEAVARKAFGTDMAAAYRWAGALGHTVRVPEGQPASAYSGGPVHDGNDAFTAELLANEGRE